MKTVRGGAAGAVPERPDANDQKHPRMSARSRNVLFLCNDNSSHSIVAEALLAHWGREHFRAYSGGAEPGGEVDPLVLDLLKSNRLWRESLRPKSCHEFLAPGAPRMDFIISLGEARPAGLPPQWPGNPQVIHWRITDPPAGGQPAEKAHSIRKAFLELENRVKLFVLVCQHESMPAAGQAA